MKLPKRPWWLRFRSRPAPDTAQWFDADEIDELLSVYSETGAAPGSAWERYRHAHMRFPTWFEPDLDPWGEAYACQQHRLWRLIAGTERVYDPQVDEKEFGWCDVDPVRRPGFYMQRNPQAITSAADHVLATGMLLKHCELRAGDWALEYGAGFGQSALALARLGVNVDTVDVSEVFCDYVRRQADFFEVPLHAFQGQFGLHPRVGQKYGLIWFYESFHHCVDFLRVVPMLTEQLQEGGRIILGGEPIVEKEYAAVPYPWGVRLHSEVAVVMRQTGWFELGFSERFLYDLFARAGFAGKRIECEPSLFGRLYIFERFGSEGRRPLALSDPQLSTVTP